MAIKEEFIASCQEGDLGKIQKLLTVLHGSNKTSILHQGVMYAAQNGHVEAVSNLLPHIAEEFEYSYRHTDDASKLASHEYNSLIQKVIFVSLENGKSEVVKDIVNNNNMLDFNFELRTKLRNSEKLSQESKQFLIDLFTEKKSSKKFFQQKQYEELQLPINDKLFLACADVDLAKIDQLLNGSSIVNANLNAQDDYAFRIAAISGNTELIKKFIFDMNIEKSEHIVKHLEAYPNEDINHYFNARDLGKIMDKEISQYMVDVGSQDVLDKQLVMACENGNLNEVKRLLTSTDIHKNANIQSHDNQALISSSRKGHFEIVKFLLTSPELKEYADITARKGESLMLAGKNGHFEVVSFLTSSPELKEHLSINMNDNQLFKNADTKFARYLVFDANIPLSDSIREILEEKKSEDINNMFKVRELNEKLASKLSSPSFNIADTLKKLRESNQNTASQKNTV